jgi:hypothetical protein
MTTKRICYDTPDGLVVIQPNPRNREEGESEDAFIARVIARNIEVAKQVDRHGNVVNPHLTEATKIHIVDAADIPKDRSDRAAWKVENGAVRVDAVKAAALRAR